MRRGKTIRSRSQETLKHCSKCFKSIDDEQYEKERIVTSSGESFLYFHDGLTDDCYESYVKGSLPHFQSRERTNLTYRQRNFQDKLYPEDQKWEIHETRK